MTETTENTERADLSWLSDATPVKTTMRTSKRGRQPGKNPVAPHVKAAHENGDTLSLPVPANVARQTERMLRRAALREGWSISVQVLNENPESATSENVIALKDLDSLPEGSDVWVSFQVRDKEEASENGSAPASETENDGDPFAGDPSADAGESGETEPETESAPAARSGRRSRK